MSTYDINEILEIENEDERLSTLYDHLLEKSSDGNDIDALNSAELVIFDLMTLYNELFSDTFHSFLFRFGDRLLPTRSALNIVGAKLALNLLDNIEAYFPNGIIPHELDLIQAELEDLDDCGIDFGREDALWNDGACDELIYKASDFIDANKRDFT